MDVEKILAQLVRIGTVTSADPVKRVARVKFQDTGMTSGQCSFAHKLRKPCT